MPNKIKIALTLVAIVAVFSVYELATYVHKIANANPTYQEGSPLSTDTITCGSCDPDHDGLTNAEEIMWGTDPFNPDTDGDGFLDGEEVKSGHNPLIPGPNDLISDSNLTNQFSNLIVSGLYSGDLKPDSTNYNQALTDISNSVTDSGKYAFSNLSNEPPLQTIIGTDENKTLYLKQIAPLLQDFQASLADEYSNYISNLDTIGASGFSDASIQTFFSGQSSEDQKISDKLSSMIVPVDFESSHSEFLKLVQQLGTINDAIANGETDPVKATSALSSVFDMYTDYANVVKNYVDEMNAQHLDLKLLEQQ